jgi:DNA-directed RNA polymerase
MQVKLGSILVDILINSTKNAAGEHPFFLEKNKNTTKMVHKRTMFRNMWFIKMESNVFSEFSKLENKDATLVLPRYPPMLVQPLKWDNRAYTGAYFTMKAPLMKAQSKTQSNAVRRAPMPKVLEALDYLGEIGWRINPVVHRVIVAAVEQKLEIADLPSRTNLNLPDKTEGCRKVSDLIKEANNAVAKYDREAAELTRRRLARRQGDKEPLPELGLTPMQVKTRVKLEELSLRDPDELQFDERRYKYMCNRVLKRNGELHSLRSDVDIKLKIADQFKDDVIYFPHNIDFRGRAYPIPPNLSHMGNDFCRGIMMFDKAKPLGEGGFKWLKIHLCNLFGHNKVSLDDRMAWVESHLDEVRDSAERPLEGRRWWLSAEEPFQALAACAEIIAAVDSGNPAAYMCRLPVHQDGSCNGLQHYAGLGRDYDGGKSVNLVPHEVPQDVYSSVLSKVLERLEKDQSDEKEELARKAMRLQGNVSRKVIKQTVMTSVYGVTKIGARDQVEARLLEVFNVDAATVTPEEERQIGLLAKYLAEATLTSLSEVFSSANKIMEWLGDCAKAIAEEVRYGRSYNVYAWCNQVVLDVCRHRIKLSHGPHRWACPYCSRTERPSRTRCRLCCRR